MEKKEKKEIRFIQQAELCYHLTVGEFSCWLNGDEILELYKVLRAEFPNIAMQTMDKYVRGWSKLNLSSCLEEDKRTKNLGIAKSKKNKHMEQFEFIGYLADDAKVIQNNGNPFISFRVGVTRKFKNKQGDAVERTKWIDCTRNGDERFAQYLKKGQMVFVRGDAEARAYLDKNNKAQGSLGCHAWDVTLLGGKPKSEEAAPF